MKGRRFDTTEEIQEESQRVLDIIPKRDFQGCFQAFRNAGTAVFVQKAMEEFNIQAKQTSFYKYCPGIFGYILVTGDESWVFDYDPETKRQSEEWHTKSSPRPKKAHMSRSRVKPMIIVFFFDSRGIVHIEFVPPGQTVNHAFYKDVLERLRKRVQRV